MLLFFNKKSMDNFINSLVKVCNENIILDNQIWNYKDENFYLDWITDDILEVKKELKLNNQVYLEDELSDILRDYFWELCILEERGYISSIDNVLNQCLEKFSARIEYKRNWIDWSIIKQKQKEELEKRHNLKYNN